MTKKVAKLVTVSLMTRVIVDRDATEAQVLDAARQNFIDKVKNELGESLEEIKPDTECPYCWQCEADVETDENGNCATCGTHIYCDDDLRSCDVCGCDIWPTETGKCPDCGYLIID